MSKKLLNFTLSIRADDEIVLSRSLNCDIPMEDCNCMLDPSILKEYSSTLKYKLKDSISDSIITHLLHAGLECNGDS